MALAFKQFNMKKCNKGRQYKLTCKYCNYTRKEKSSNCRCPRCGYWPARKKKKFRSFGPLQKPIFKDEWPSLDIQYGWFDGELVKRKRRRFTIKYLRYYKIRGSHLL